MIANNLTRERSHPIKTSHSWVHLMIYCFCGICQIVIVIGSVNLDALLSIQHSETHLYFVLSLNFVYWAFGFELSALFADTIPIAP